MGWAGWGPSSIILRQRSLSNKHSAQASNERLGAKVQQQNTGHQVVAQGGWMTVKYSCVVRGVAKK